MAYLRNTTVNLLNLHYGIHSLALSGSGAFFVAYLLHAGVSAPAALASLALIVVGRFAMRPFILAPAKRWGLKPLVIAGTLVTGLQYPLLAEVHGIGWGLLALCLVGSIGDTLYWTSYHAYYASLGDAEHRGHQLGAREAVAAIVGVIGPLLTGWALVALGPRIAFGATAVVLLIAALPLLGTPNVRIAETAPGAFRSALPGVLMFMADGWITATGIFVWQIALFLSLGESFTAYGGAMALAALAGALCGLLLGRLIDIGHGRRAVWLVAGSLALVMALRAASYGHPVLAVIANVAGALTPSLYTATLMTAVYNQAKGSACATRFHIAAEAGWDVGAASGCLTAAGLLWAGAPMSLAILISIVGIAGVTILLQRYYGEASAKTPAAAPGPPVERV